MPNLLVAYSALAVFGIGVTIVDMLGLFARAEAADQDDGGVHDGGGHGDAGHGDTAGQDGGGQDGDDGHDGAESAGEHDGGYDGSVLDSAIGGHEGAHDAGEGEGAAEGVHGLETAGAGHHGDHAGEHGAAGHGSVVASADSGVRSVARAIGALRMGVYFSLGAGPTGVFATLTGVAPWPALAWSVGAGVFIAALSRTLRSLIRRDLDSSIQPGEFIMDEATITVPVEPGAMGKASVRRYGVERELFVRAKDPGRAFGKGEAVRIVDIDDDCYWIEPR